ncbi:MAG TPA: ubiquitin-like small modifier protein 1 [Symbiobacteriaceae bacterium]|jgi:molybdopterin synthase sulfur carrier subunit
MQIRLYATLRPLAGGKYVTLEAEAGETVGSLLRRLVAQYPGLAGQLLAPDEASLLPHVQVFLSGRSVRDLQGLQTPVPAEAELAVFPPVAGG